MSRSARVNRSFWHSTFSEPAPTRCQGSPTAIPSRSLRTHTSAHRTKQTCNWGYRERRAIGSNSRFQARHIATTADPDFECAPFKDVVVVGAGPIGLSVACGIVASTQKAAVSIQKIRALSAYPSITIVEGGDLARLRNWASKAEERAYSSNSDTPWENRVISLTAENMEWLATIGVSPFLVQSRLWPVRDMRVWDGLSDATIEFHADEAFDVSSAPSSLSNGARATLSYMVEISNLQQAMLRYLEEHGQGQVQVKDRTRVQSIAANPEDGGVSSSFLDQWPVLSLGADTEDTTHLRARLLVGADGPDSPVRRYAGIENYGWEYGRRGVVGTLRCIKPTGGDANSGEEVPFVNTAFQRFLPTGPIAFLPLEHGVGSMVWTLPPDLARAVEHIHRDTPTNTAVQPFAELISAAFRLPWIYLDRIFQEIRGRAKASASASGSSASASNANDWSWLVKIISDSVREAGGLEALPDHGDGFVPAPVRSVDPHSVASFPLQVKHADVYLGAAVNGSASTTSRSLHTLSGALNTGLTILGLASANAGTNEGKGRTALVGDAAHSIHPLAGQGLNLGLADARSLVGTLERAVQSGADLGSYTALRGYARERYCENQKMLSAVDHLHWLYASPVPLAYQHTAGYGMQEAGKEPFFEEPLRAFAREGFARSTVWARSTGLEVVNELRAVKNAFIRHAGGRSAK
ncbi:ubiquinone biosynthesis hydrox [Tilletiaria anomala UBC 951]|uniref:Ubiquinone biosynthesis hydrox n=1 Tax=Tilletiaria anomala (strain ATCC 24038 / CBS 436.72 / UBC 951) TaxID=1037660 RepID=A0A066WEV5_TILAU|nr:ubiquinone biosynthesis hydrox [Tilletiaria anomala UBC 951]KDN52477.1 ubiquinone biosynthesis hydrox [Tilletiaria anomala UBC 951]